MAFSKQRRISTPLKGVNLGGWLVLEPWIAPSLFEDTNAVDEYGYCLQEGAAAKQRLEVFRNTFISEQDFAWLAEQGIEVVRLPVGYWLFGDAGPYAPTIDYVDRAFGWAKTHGLLILLDLHGAPGSQNGNMHSGKSGVVGWHTEAQHMTNTMAVLKRLAKRYGQHPALLGISLLNEPASQIPASILERFYVDAYHIVLKHCRTGVWVVFSDAFRHRAWRRRMPKKDFPDLYIDHHHYQLFSILDKLLPVRAQLWRSKYLLPGKLRRIAADHPLIIGEWSLALRAEKLQGHDQSAIAKDYAQTQLKALNCSSAWFYWTYKTETGGPWSFRDCIDSGFLELT